MVYKYRRVFALLWKDREAMGAPDRSSDIEEVAIIHRSAIKLEKLNHIMGRHVERSITA